MQEKSFGGLAARGPAAELTALPMQTECCIEGSESGSGERWCVVKEGRVGTTGRKGGKRKRMKGMAGPPRFRNMDTPVELEEL